VGWIIDVVVEIGEGEWKAIIPMLMLLPMMSLILGRAASAAVVVPIIILILPLIRKASRAVDGDDGHSKMPFLRSNSNAEHYLSNSRSSSSNSCSHQ